MVYIYGTFQLYLRMSTCAWSYAKNDCMLHYSTAYMPILTSLSPYIILFSATWGCRPSVHVHEALKSLLNVEYRLQL